MIGKYVDPDESVGRAVGSFVSSPVKQNGLLIYCWTPIYLDNKVTIQMYNSQLTIGTI